MTYTKDNTAKLQTIIAEGKAIVESLEASERELQSRARERAAQIRRYQIAEELCIKTALVANTNNCSN